MSDLKELSNEELLMQYGEAHFDCIPDSCECYLNFDEVKKIFEHIKNINDEILRRLNKDTSND